MATIEEKQIAKEILLALIDKDLVRYDDFPEQKTYLGLVTNTYQEILKSVSESE